MSVSGSNYDSVEIRPGVGFYRLIPSLRYSSWVALGEMVDNSIQSFDQHREKLQALHGPKYKLRIDIEFHNGDTPWISVTDNAAGIYEEDYQRAFTPATPPSDKSGISQYGIGMKSSACWFSRYFTVTSAALGESQKKTVTFDIQKILDENKDHLYVENEPKAVNEHGTRIEMHQLLQPLPIGGALSKTRNYLRSIYREWLRSGEIVLVVGGEVLSYQPPSWLEESYWPNEKGPGPTQKEQWVVDIDIELDESWAADLNIDKASQPPRIYGFVAILGKGSTKQAGLSLVWRKKVVQGAGGEAESQDDQYRPREIFGTGNSFRSQRIFGELDVSELKVTSFKDAINWSAGQEEEFVKKLLLELNNPDKPLLKMADHFRVTAASPKISKGIESALESVVQSTSGALISELGSENHGQQILPRDVEEIPEPPLSKEDEKSTRKDTIILTPNFETNVVLEIKTQSDDNAWLRVVHENDKWRISMNRAHPFMNSFVVSGDTDFNPMLRIALALGLAEIASKNAGRADADFIRLQVNNYLRGPLAQSGSLEEK